LPVGVVEAAQRGDAEVDLEAEGFGDLVVGADADAGFR